MQKDLEAAHPVLRIQLLGVNAKGQEAGNDATTQGRELPWLQDVDANQDGLADAGPLWSANYRSVYVLDGSNVQVAAFDVETNDLAEAENYAALRALLVDAAMTSQRPWRNADNPLDVNGNGGVEPLDALNIINKLNSEGPHTLPPPEAGDLPLRYYDCNGDGDVGPIDALNVINHLNGQGGATGAEGEGQAAEPAISRPDEPVSFAGIPPSPDAADARAGQTRQAVMEQGGVLPPSRETSIGVRDTVRLLAESSYSDADPAAVELLKSHPLQQWDWWFTVCAADELLPDAPDVEAVRDL